jgi:hypothetical protein
MGGLVALSWFRRVLAGGLIAGCVVGAVLFPQGSAAAAPPESPVASHIEFDFQSEYPSPDCYTPEEQPEGEVYTYCFFFEGRLTFTRTPAGTETYNLFYKKAGYDLYLNGQFVTSAFSQPNHSVSVYDYRIGDYRLSLTFTVNREVTSSGAMYCQRYTFVLANGEVVNANTKAC